MYRGIIIIYDHNVYGYKFCNEKRICVKSRKGIGRLVKLKNNKIPPMKWDKEIHKFGYIRRSFFIALFFSQICKLS